MVDGQWSRLRALRFGGQAIGDRPWSIVDRPAFALRASAGKQGLMGAETMRSSVVTPSCGFRDELPALAEQRGLDAVGVGHEGFHVGLEMKEDELGVELEA